MQLRVSTSDPEQSKKGTEKFTSLQEEAATFPGIFYKDIIRRGVDSKLNCQRLSPRWQKEHQQRIFMDNLVEFVSIKSEWVLS